MLFYAATLFLPSPAVPYVRLSLFLVTRWKPLPPRHLCNTQAHPLILVAPAPRGPLLREVLLSIPIIAPTASSASLTNSSRFQISTLIRKVSCHSRRAPDVLIRPSPIYSVSPSLHAVILTPAGRFAARVCCFTKRLSLRLERRGSTPTSCSHRLPPVARRAAHFPRLQCSLYATACKVARPTETAPSAFARVWVLVHPSLPAFGRPPASRI